MACCIGNNRGLYKSHKKPYKHKPIRDVELMK
jgi:hypothetical protein